MKTVKSFKAKKKTNRFNKNQKVWIRDVQQNCILIYFKWRGKGRYVKGVVDSWSPCVGEIREFEVSNTFADRILKGML